MGLCAEFTGGSAPEQGWCSHLAEPTASHLHLGMDCMGKPGLLNLGKLFCSAVPALNSEGY